MATRGGETPRVWLVAHLDSKSQPVPLLVRVAGVALLAVALLLALVARARCTLAGGPEPYDLVGWRSSLAALGAVPVMASVVGATISRRARQRVGRRGGARGRGAAATTRGGRRADHRVRRSWGSPARARGRDDVGGTTAWSRSTATASTTTGALTVMYTVRRRRPTSSRPFARRVAAARGCVACRLGLLTDSRGARRRRVARR